MVKNELISKSRNCASDVSRGNYTAPRKCLIIAGFADSILEFRGDLIMQMISEGYLVHVAAPDLDGSSVGAALTDRGVTAHSLPLQRGGLNPVRDFLSFFALLRLIARLRPEIVFTYTIKPVLYGTLAAWLLRVRKRVALITGLGYAFEDARKDTLLQCLVILMYRQALSHATRVFFQNQDDLTLFYSLGILPKGARATVVNGSGVNTVHYAMSSPHSEPVVFLFIGRFLLAKGLREYVQAARLVKRQFPAVIFQVAGWRDKKTPDVVPEEEFQGWVAEGVIAPLGRLADVRPAIVNASVYVLPSYREGTPRTVLEAMAMGRPIITTDVPGCRETVINGENGFLVPVRKYKELAEAMIRFIQEPTLIESMGRRSRQIVEEKYDVRKVNAVMLREMAFHDQEML